MDQTAVLLLPTWQKSWSPKGSPCTVVKDEKTMITCCVAMTPVLGQLCAQLIYHGKTARVHPQGPCGPGLTCTHSPNHWSNFDTMKELLVQLDEFLCGSPSSKEPWVLLLDLCPIHISVGFRTFVKEEYPHVQLCFVAAGTTGFCQPLDIAAMRPFKLKLRQLTSQQLSLQILSAEGFDMKTELNNVILRQSVMNWVSAALKDLREDEGLVRRAWAHLQCESEDDYQETVRLAREDHEQGLLFPAHRGMVPEEAPAAPAPAAAAAEEEQLWQDDEDGEVLDLLPARLQAT